MAARCKDCGCELQSDTALYCVRCYQRNLKMCPTCRLPGGKVRLEYRDHYIDKRYVKGKLCPACLGERWIFVP